MPNDNAIDARLKIASASLKGYRRRGDKVLTEFWQQEVDRLLDARLTTKVPA
jgi:hypothetical protein